jgi:hypothetical protein
MGAQSIQRSSKTRRYVLRPRGRSRQRNTSAVLYLGPRSTWTAVNDESDYRAPVWALTRGAQMKGSI